MVDFVKGNAKTTWLRRTWPSSTGAEGVLFIGRAQEKTTVFRTEKRLNPNTGAGATRGSCGPRRMVNHFYVYAVDGDFGPFFLKFCSYFPTTPSYA